MRAAVLLTMLATAACSNHADHAAAVVDVNAAASRAESNIARYAATRQGARPTVAKGVAAAPDRPVGAATMAALSASEAEAVAVVTDYFAAIGAHRYHDAWLSWRDGGKGSGLSEDAFARSFAAYASLSATVGMPYDEDAGAGQRYVTVPVTASGVLTGGGRFVLAGPVVLHRVADGIETIDPAAHLWRIERSDLKPVGAASRH